MKNSQFSIKTLITILLYLLLTTTVVAQTPDSTLTNTQSKDTIYTKAKINGRYLKSYLTDAKDIIIAPVKWSGKEWIAAGAFIGGTVLLYQYDSKIRDYFQSKQTDLGHNITKYGLEPWGGVYTFSTLALFYGQGLIWKNERSKKVALMGIKAFVLSGLYVQIPKMLLNRHRPYHDDPPNPHIWDGPSLDMYKGFPSGHTTSVFAVAAVIASEYRETIWVPIVTYSLASMVGLSRMYDDNHWSSDVFFGAAFGWAIGKLIHASSNWKIQTAPMITNESAGLYLNYQF